MQRAGTLRVRHGISAPVRPHASPGMLQATVVPLLPAKLQSEPQRSSIGKQYADEAAFEANLAAWHAEQAERGVKFRKSQHLTEKGEKLRWPYLDK